MSNRDLFLPALNVRINPILETHLKERLWRKGLLLETNIKLQVFCSPVQLRFCNTENPFSSSLLGKGNNVFLFKPFFNYVKWAFLK